MADPGFPVGGVDLVGGGCGLPRQLRFENFVCQNERIGTLRGGAHQAHPPRSTNVSVLVLNSTVSTPYYIVLDMIPRITVHFVRLYIINLLVFSTASIACQNYSRKGLNSLSMARLICVRVTNQAFCELMHKSVYLDFVQVSESNEIEFYCFHLEIRFNEFHHENQQNACSL